MEGQDDEDGDSGNSSEEMSEDGSSSDGEVDEDRSSSSGIPTIEHTRDVILGREVELRLGSYNWDDHDWDNYGIKAEDRVNEGEPDINIDRGEADYTVKGTGDDVLKCCRGLLVMDALGHFQRASDSLRKLFREHSWETIRKMDGYNANHNVELRDPSLAYRYWWPVGRYC